MKTAKISNSVIEEIKSTLFSKEPDMIKLNNWVQTALNLSGEEAFGVIYSIVKQLNMTFFPPVTKLEIIHTDACNLSCYYCFEKRAQGHKKIDPETAEAAIDLLFDYSGKETSLGILHFGGEPMLNFPSVKHATEYAEKKAIQFGKSLDLSMTTNGTLLNPAVVQYFSDHRIKVLLSTDGIGPRHDRFRVDKKGNGTFEQVMNGLKILKDKQAWVGIKMTIMPENIPYLIDDVKAFYDMGINQFLISAATGISWSEENMKSFAKQWARLYIWYKSRKSEALRIREFDEMSGEMGFFGCHAGKTNLTVTPDGSLSPCSKVLALNSGKLIYKLGDVKYGLFQMQNRYELVSCSLLEGACKELGIEKEYQGGCFASNYEENSDIFQPSMQDFKFSRIKEKALALQAPFE